MPLGGGGGRGGEQYEVTTLNTAPPPPLMGANRLQWPLVRLGPENINKNLVFKGSFLPTALVMDFYASKSIITVRPVPYSIKNMYIISQNVGIFFNKLSKPALFLEKVTSISNSLSISGKSWKANVKSL